LDKISSDRRSRNMAAIRSSDTSIERRIRGLLFFKGYRFRKNTRYLFGNPDIYFVREKLIIFIDGCFWHGHQGCIDFRIPATNTEYWQAKISKTEERDAKNRAELRRQGFFVLSFWQCEVEKNPHRVVHLIETKLCDIRNSIVS